MFDFLKPEANTVQPQKVVQNNEAKADIDFSNFQQQLEQETARLKAERDAQQAQVEAVQQEQEAIVEAPVRNSDAIINAIKADVKGYDERPTISPTLPTTAFKKDYTPGSPYMLQREQEFVDAGIEAGRDEAEVRAQWKNLNTPVGEYDEESNTITQSNPDQANPYPGYMASKTEGGITKSASYINPERKTPTSEDPNIQPMKPKDNVPDYLADPFQVPGWDTETQQVQQQTIPTDSGYSIGNANDFSNVGNDVAPMEMEARDELDAVRMKLEKEIGEFEEYSPQAAIIGGLAAAGIAALINRGHPQAHIAAAKAGLTSFGSINDRAGRLKYAKAYLAGGYSPDEVAEYVEHGKKSVIGKRVQAAKSTYVKGAGWNQADRTYDGIPATKRYFRDQATGAEFVYFTNNKTGERVEDSAGNRVVQPNNLVARQQVAYQEQEAKLRQLELENRMKLAYDADKARVEQQQSDLMSKTPYNSRKPVPAEALTDMTESQGRAYRTSYLMIPAAQRIFKNPTFGDSSATNLLQQWAAGKNVTNLLSTPEARNYIKDIDVLADNYAYMMSGAAATDSQYQRYYNQFKTRLGDSAENQQRLGEMITDMIYSNNALSGKAGPFLDRHFEQGGRVQQVETEADKYFN